MLRNIPKEAIEPIVTPEIGMPPDYRTKLVKGGRYRLVSDECDGFTMEHKTYACRAIIDDFNGTSLDSVVMKQIDGTNSTIFSLTKADCNAMGIEFEEGLQLFPISMNWQRMDEPQANFDPQDMSTYPFINEGHVVRCKLKVPRPRLAQNISIKRITNTIWYRILRKSGRTITLDVCLYPSEPTKGKSLSDIITVIYDDTRMDDIIYSLAEYSQNMMSVSPNNWRL